MLAQRNKGFDAATTKKHKSLRLHLLRTVTRPSGSMRLKTNGLKMTSLPSPWPQGRESCSFHTDSGQRSRLASLGGVALDFLCLQVSTRLGNNTSGMRFILCSAFGSGRVPLRHQLRGKNRVWRKSGRFLGERSFCGLQLTKRGPNPSISRGTDYIRYVSETFTRYVLVRYHFPEGVGLNFGTPGISGREYNTRLAGNTIPVWPGI